MTEMIWVAIGGAVGSLARFLLNKWVSDSVGAVFPYGILLINVVGSLIIGLAAGFLAQPKTPSVVAIVAPLVMVGLCGGFTTFSSFSLQTWQMIQAGEWLRVVINIVLSVGLCLAATGIGFWITAAVKP
jgi:fluoride exporter